MAERAKCDITFDQIHLQYGNSGLEGMALGQAVIVGCPEETDKQIQEIIGYRPYVYTNEENLKETIKKLVEDEEYRLEMGKIGRKYVEDWHDDRKVAEKMIGIYERL
jgi:glycosyltransferase involved in cell wall biosynthesis